MDNWKTGNPPDGDKSYLCKDENGYYEVCDWLYDYSRQEWRWYIKTQGFKIKFWMEITV
jgi:hypothetical protein